MTGGVLLNIKYFRVFANLPGTRRLAHKLLPGYG